MEKDERDGQDLAGSSTLSMALDKDAELWTRKSNVQIPIRANCVQIEFQSKLSNDSLIWGADFSREIAFLFLPYYLETAGSF